MKMNNSRLLISLFLSLLVCWGAFSASGQGPSASTNAVEKHWDGPDDSALMIPIATETLEDVMAIFGEGADVKRFRKIADRRTEMLKHGNPRCKLLGLHLQHVLCYYLVTSAVRANKNGSFDLSAEPWKTIVKMADFNTDTLYNTVNSLQAGIGAKVKSRNTSKSAFEDGKLSKYIDEISKTDDSFRTNWVHPCFLALFAPQLVAI
jgi:hypothetical protein